MEMPRFNLVGIFLVQNQDCKVHRGTYQGMEKVKAAALREKIYSLVNELRLEGNLRSCSINFDTMEVEGLPRIVCSIHT